MPCFLYSVNVLCHKYLSYVSVSLMQVSINYYQLAIHYHLHVLTTWNKIDIRLANDLRRINSKGPHFKNYNLEAFSAIISPSLCVKDEGKRKYKHMNKKPATSPVLLFSWWISINKDCLLRNNLEDRSISSFLFIFYHTNKGILSCLDT